MAALKIQSFTFIIFFSAPYFIPPTLLEARLFCEQLRKKGKFNKWVGNSSARVWN